MTTRPLRIAVTVDPEIPVPPTLYGGIERVVDFLVRELCRRGHQVTLFAHPDSRTPAELVPYGVPPHRGKAARLRELWQVGGRLWRWRKRFDVVHSFGRLAALAPILPVRRLAKIQSYQRDGVPWRSVAVAVRLAGPSVRFTGCSSSVFRASPAGPRGGEWQTIFNGVDMSIYQPTPIVAADAPLVFLGRLERFKGAHTAIAIAKAAGRRLAIAGNQVRSGPEPDYFDREIAPHLGKDGIEYLGPVDDAAKNRLLGQAAAFLMPIEWEEPFGIVMAEALACGTPVIGFPRGSVPEVVRDGVNGFAAPDAAAAVAAVPRAAALDRRAIRADAEARFGHVALADQYEALYRDALAAGRSPALDHAHA